MGVDEKSNNFFNDCLDVAFARAEKDRDSKESFGVLFEKVCREKSRSANGGNGEGVNGRPLEMKNCGKPVNTKDWETPLLKWHRANLELPTGASFYELGNTWNEDEPYGFDGDHTAVEPSWKLVMEQLADGLDILDNSPVTEIRVVLPNGTTPIEIPKASKPTEKELLIPNDVEHSGKNENYTHSTKEVTNDENHITKSPKHEMKDEVIDDEVMKDREELEPEIPLPLAAPVRKYVKRVTKAKKAFDLAVDAVENKRFSRRTRNIGTDVRRSSRSTKGVIERLEYVRGA